MNINKVTVLGSGTMGHGIAQATILAGYTTTLYDIDSKMLEKGIQTITSNIEKYFVSKGKISVDHGDLAIKRLTSSTDLSVAAASADFVIEAVPEKLELKKKIFADLDQICPSNTIFASNTSVLPVTAIAGATSRPDRCIGTHFFNPAAVMKLVEVILPIGVSEETVTTTMAFCEKLGKRAVKVKDMPGFIVNRLLGLLYQEAAQMVSEGAATAEEIDMAMRLGAGYPMGPCELADFGGFDVIQMAQDATFEYTHRETDRLNVLYRKMLEAGRLGRKNGKGFYDYHSDGTKTPFKLY